jgi:hypothetical protein
VCLYPEFVEDPETQQWRFTPDTAHNSLVLDMALATEV